MLLKKSHNVVVQPLLSHVPGQSVHVIGYVSVGAVVQQCLGSLVAPLSARKEQWGLVLVVLGVSISAVSEEGVDGIDIVDAGGPVQGRLTILVASIDIGVRLNELLNNAFYGKPGGKYQRRRSIIGFGIKICCSVAKQNLEHTLGIGSYGSV